MKKFLSGLLMAVISFGCLIPAMGQEPKLEEVTKIDNYMQNVVEVTHNPFAQENLPATFSASKNNDETVSNKEVSDELNIKQYDIDECEQVYMVNEDFFDKINNGEISISEDDFVWYVPIVNAERKNGVVIFDDCSGDLLPISMSIPQNNSSSKIMKKREVESIIKRGNLNCKKMIYFILPTLHDAAVSVYIETDSNEKYVMVVDNTIYDRMLQPGQLYTIEEIKDLI